MKKLFFVAILSLLSFSAQAQNGRSAVSRTGLDTNNCQVATPCRTFAAAVAVTNPYGNIICLDRAGFGNTTITKSVTIDCSIAEGFVTVPAAGDGITINSPTLVNVTLRGIFVEGNTTGQNGVRMLAPGTLFLDNVQIYNNVGFGVDVEPPVGSAVVTIQNSILTHNAGGNIHTAPVAPATANVVTFNSTLMDSK